MGISAVTTFAFIGPLELGILLLIVLIIVGGRRLPILGRQLGAGVKEFKETVESHLDRDAEDDDEDAGRSRPAAIAPPAAADAEGAPVEGRPTREPR